MKKRELTLSIIGIFSIIFITTGITFAFFNYNKQGTTDNTITTGSITFLYTEVDKVGKGISITDAFPMSDAKGMDQTGEDKVFNFKITSTTSNSNSIPYEITVRKSKDSTLKDDSAVKLYLTKVDQGGNNETKVILKKYSELKQTKKIDETKYTEKTIHTDEVPANSTQYEQNYRLRMWIDDQTDFSDGDMNNQTFKVTVNVYANAEIITEETGSKEINPNNVLKKLRGLNAGDFIVSNQDITKIVIEDQLNPKDGLEYKDISETQQGGVIEYYDPTDKTLYIQADGKVVANSDSAVLFSSFSNLTSIEGLENFDTSQVTNMKGMFSSCKNLTTLDLNSWDTSQVTDMTAMFSGCTNLTDLKINNWDVSSVTTMQEMFENCTNLETLDLNNWKPSALVFTVQMFLNCTNLHDLKIRDWNTTSLTTTGSMFQDCTSLETLDLNGWNTSQITNMNLMFSGCTNLRNLAIDQLYFPKYTNISSSTSSPFYNCKNLITTLNVISLDRSSLMNIIAGAATEPGSMITINYTEEMEDILDQLLAIDSFTKAFHFQKGDLITLPES